jgi:hypothetical protein
MSWRGTIADEVAGERPEQLEHFQEKACPGLDPGWNPVFGPKMRPRKKARAQQFPTKLNVL